VILMSEVYAKQTATAVQWGDGVEHTLVYRPRFTTIEIKAVLSSRGLDIDMDGVGVIPSRIIFHATVIVPGDWIITEDDTGEVSVLTDEAYRESKWSTTPPVDRELFAEAIELLKQTCVVLDPGSVRWAIQRTLKKLEATDNDTGDKG